MTASDVRTRRKWNSKHEQRFETTQTNAAFVLFPVLNALGEW
jgi:hypothetical protein